MSINPILLAMDVYIINIYDNPYQLSYEELYKYELNLYINQHNSFAYVCKLHGATKPKFEIIREILTYINEDNITSTLQDISYIDLLFILHMTQLSNSEYIVDIFMSLFIRLYTTYFDINTLILNFLVCFDSGSYYFMFNRLNIFTRKYFLEFLINVGLNVNMMVFDRIPLYIDIIADIFINSTCDEKIKMMYNAGMNIEICWGLKGGTILHWVAKIKLLNLEEHTYNIARCLLEYY